MQSAHKLMKFHDNSSCVSDIAETIKKQGLRQHQQQQQQQNGTKNESAALALALTLHGSQHGAVTQQHLGALAIQPNILTVPGSIFW